MSFDMPDRVVVAFFIVTAVFDNWAKQVKYCVMLLDVII